MLAVHTAVAPLRGPRIVTNSSETRDNPGLRPALARLVLGRKQCRQRHTHEQRKVAS